MVFAVSGDGSNIDIPAVFISRDAGYILSEFVGEKDARVYLLPALETSAWSILAISSISLLTISAVLSTFFLLRRQQLRRVAIHVLQEPTGLSSDEIKALSTSIYNKKDIACPETCAICLEEFEHGETLRIFQCNHGRAVSLSL
jgi:E3 ubiquitin-protein ligase RNF13